MNREALDLAKLGLETFSEVRGSEYDEINRRLNLGLEIGQFTLDSLRHSAEQASYNGELIKEFVASLPHATARENWYGEFHSWGFKVSEQSTAKWIQETVLWVTPDAYVRPMPFYIVGKLYKPGEKWISLLLAPPALDGAKAREFQITRMLEVKAKALQEREKKAIPRIDEQYTPEELERLFDVLTRELEIDYSSPNSLLVTSFGTNRFEHYGNDVEKITGRVDRDTYPFGITDEQVGQFNLFGKLNHLAEAFDKTDVLQTLLEKRKKQAEDSPLEQVLEESN
jgi:hypothetical protein